jgi:hypothetical protein
MDTSSSSTCLHVYNTRQALTWIDVYIMINRKEPSRTLKLAVYPDPTADLADLPTYLVTYREIHIPIGPS